MVKSYCYWIWSKGIWPVNSPDHSPIENLWFILEDDSDLKGGSKYSKILEEQIKVVVVLDVYAMLYLFQSILGH